MAQIVLTSKTRLEFIKMTYSDVPGGVWKRDLIQKAEWKGNRSLDGCMETL